MHSMDFSGVLQQLKQQEEQLVSEMEALDATLSQKREDLGRVRGAIASLTEGPPEKSNGKAPRKGKPAASKADVRRAVDRVRQDSDRTQSEDQVRSLAEERLVSEGFSRAGLALRFREVLGSA